MATRRKEDRTAAASDRARPARPAPLCCSPRDADGALRRRFFAEGADAVARYGVGMERLLEHLDEGWRAQPRLAGQPVAHVADVLHAIACLDGVPRAWSDLAEQYERALVRIARGHLGPMESIVFVRRLIACLRRGEPLAGSQPTLREYLGTRPLRGWLADRVVGAINRCARTRAAGRPEHLVEPKVAAAPRREPPIVPALGPLPGLAWSEAVTLDVLPGAGPTPRAWRIHALADAGLGGPIPARLTT